MLIADELMQAHNSNQEITTLLEEQLEPLIQQVVASFEMAGLAIGIVRGDEVVYAKGFGVKHLETREPVTPTSLFHLASVSKPFVATAIMQLAEQWRGRACPGKHRSSTPTQSKGSSCSGSSQKAG